MSQWDLIYVEQDGVRTMSLSVGVGEDAEMVGPFPAREAGPKIASALAARGLFSDQKKAESAYIMRHFAYMASGENGAGIAYPYCLPT